MRFDTFHRQTGEETLQRKGLRGTVVTFIGDPFLQEDALQTYEDGVVTVADGCIEAVEPFHPSRHARPDLSLIDYTGHVICPGFIDAHVHYPQLEVIGAFGTQLLDWLEHYTFPTEQKFSDRLYAQKVAALFLRELLRRGTTTAAVYCTVHPQSVEAFFAESERFNTRMIAGKLLMDRNAPPDLLDTAETGYAQSKALIETWHGRGRQLYAITPRFAPTSTKAQLEAAGRLWSEHPGVYMQTHLAEDRREIEWVARLFPEASSYLDVYARAGLVGRGAIFGHCIHMSEVDFCRCHATGSAIAHCPTSNLFLGSGLFRLFDAKRADRPVKVGIGTDVGGGTSLSQLQSLNEAYKIAALNGTKLTAQQALFLATRGGAQALQLEARIGSLEPGFEADMVVLDPRATPLLAHRTTQSREIADVLFALMTFASERSVRATYVAGQCVFDREAGEAPFRYADQTDASESVSL